MGAMLTRDLVLKLRVESDARMATTDMKMLAAELERVERLKSKTEKGLQESFGGPRGGVGASGGGIGGYNPVGMSVPTFDRPIPVVIVGPRPLPVSGTGGPGGAIGNAQDFKLFNALAARAAGNFGPLGAGDSSDRQNRAAYEARIRAGQQLVSYSPQVDYTKAMGEKGKEAEAGKDVTLGAIGAKITAASVAVAGFASTAAGLSKAFLEMDHNALNAREKTLGLAKAIPLVGSSLYSLGNSLFGMIEQFRNPTMARDVMNARAGQPEMMGRIDLAWQKHGQVQGLDRETIDMKIRARAFEMMPGAAHANNALMGFAGVTPVSSLDPRIQDSLDEVRKSQRELAVMEEQAKAARGNLTFHQEFAAKKSAEEEDATRRANDARAAAIPTGPAAEAQRQQDRSWGARALIALNPMTMFMGAGTGANMGEKVGPQIRGSIEQNPLTLALLKEQQAIQESLKAQAELERAATLDKEKQLQLQQKRYDLENKLTGVMKARLSIIEQEEQRARTGAAEFGGMDAVSQQNLLDAARRFKAEGRKGVTEGEYGMLRSNSLTSGAIGQEAVKDVQGNAAYKDILQLFGQRDLQTITQERVKLASDIKIKVELDEDQFNKMMAKAMEDANGNLTGIIGRIIETQVGKLVSDMRLGNQLRGQ